MAYAVDTLQVVKTLQKANFTAEQAEAIAGIIVSDESGLATKQDIAALKQDIVSLERTLKQDIAMLEQRITIKVGGLLIAILGGFEVIKAYIIH